MTKSKSAARQVAKKRRSQLNKPITKRAMPLTTRDPVRTVQIKSHENGAEPTRGKRAKTNSSEGSSSNDSVTPLNGGLFTMLMQWSPLGIFLRQQAFLADAMGRSAQTSRR